MELDTKEITYYKPVPVTSVWVVSGSWLCVCVVHIRLHNIMRVRVTIVNWCMDVCILILMSTCLQSMTINSNGKPSVHQLTRSSSSEGPPEQSSHLQATWTFYPLQSFSFLLKVNSRDSLYCFFVFCSAS